MNSQKYKVVSNYIYSPSDVLGTGTWGTVYRAKLKDSDQQTEFALKKMNKFKVEASQKSFEKYQSQVLTLQKSGVIPQVIKIIDFFKSKSNYYIVTQYEPLSKDLYDYMLQHKQKFCEEEARIIWQDLLHGIKSLHEMGIYHRDLKLQNIVYSYKQMKAKIIDFGMATCFPNPEGMVGSPMFMSPQVLSNSKYTYKCDIWSLGILFYCMVYRSSPYGENITAKSILEKMAQIKKQGVNFPYETFVSKQCKQVIIACLDYQQKDRMQIEDILKLDFFKKIEIPENALQYYQPSTSFKT